MNTNLETNRVIRLSSCHISAVSTVWLETLCESHASCCALVGYKSQSSYILYCMSFEMLNDERDCIPSDILNLVAFANALGCDVIWLDPIYHALSYLYTCDDTAMTTLDKPDIYTMLTLSTGHISEASRMLLNNIRLSKTQDEMMSLSSLLSKSEYGWFIFGVHDKLYDSIPVDLHKVISYAVHQGYNAICFDCDGIRIDELKWFSS